MEEKIIDKQEEIPENLKEIQKMIGKAKELSKEEIKKLEKEAEESVDFLKKIDEIELPTNKYVIFTDGEEQLLYENEEFYTISSTDSRKTKKKRTKKEATDLYLEYFIKYQLNPILEKREINKEKQISIVEKFKDIQITEQAKTEQVQEKQIEQEDLTI